ncbi:MAG TPA: TrmH family RNA methyltransferase [Candidatus Saccharimonadales bacterium]|jgi:tRNA G18 (ribose-2'-O)-methylase SpoU|nr:TrmH family RNA methyltransferase [Candidatus Saccharimonadales bacterium]
MKTTARIILIAHNLRSTHNVGSLLRTADGLGVNEVWLSGYTPHPKAEDDDRLPHLAAKIDKQIAKTALGAEKSVKWRQTANIQEALLELKANGYLVVGLEQAENAIPLPEFKPPEKVALIVGREVEGLEPEVLSWCDAIVEIPMFGQKESFNVAVAAAMTLYSLRYLA